MFQNRVEVTNDNVESSRQPCIYDFAQSNTTFNCCDILEAIESHAQLTPNVCALVVNGKGISYAKLNRCANRLARLLLARGVTYESIVALSLPHTIDMIMALLAIYKAGAAYLVIDNTLPKYSVDTLFSNTQVDAALTDYKDRRLFDSLAYEKVIFMGCIHDDISNYSSANVRLPIYNKQPACLLYPSITRISSQLETIKRMQASQIGELNIALPEKVYITRAVLSSFLHSIKIKSDVPNHWSTSNRWSRASSAYELLLPLIQGDCLGLRKKGEVINENNRSLTNQLSFSVTP